MLQIKVMTNATSRFSSRVANYIKYRPSYPAQVIDCLREQCGLSANSIVADVGSGTGIFSQLLLPVAGHVYGVEPNREMREAGERLLKGYTHFSSLDGTGEATTLPDHSVDIITAAQAFHWFDRVKARQEFVRILKPGGWLVLTWNGRREDSTPFLTAYEEMLQRYSTDYAQINHRNIDDDAVSAFYAPQAVSIAHFDNVQMFDYDGAKGRLLSSSYVPDVGQPHHEAMMREMESIFAQHQQHGQVAFEYDTVLYVGRLA